MEGLPPIVPTPRPASRAEIPEPVYFAAPVTEPQNRRLEAWMDRRIAHIAKWGIGLFLGFVVGVVAENRFDIIRLEAWTVVIEQIDERVDRLEEQMLRRSD